MPYPYTRSRACSELPDSDIEPSDTAPSAATSPPRSIFVGPHVEAVEGTESVSAESAGPVSAPTSLSLPARGPPSSGSHGVIGSAGPSLVGVSALGYPSGQPDPRDSSMYTVGQMSTSLVTGTARAEVHAESELERSSYSTSSRQPPATAAAKTAAAEGPTVALNCDRPTRRAQSLSARTSSSFLSLSPPVLSPAHNVELSQSVPLSRGRAASSQRVVSQCAPSLSPSQSTFSYGAPSPPIGSDIEAEYPAARPSVFQPSLVDTSVDRVYPVAARADVGRMSLPYASVDVGGPRPAVVAHPGSLDVASSRTHVRS